VNYSAWSVPAPEERRSPAKIARMFDAVAPRYDAMNALLSFGQDAHWRRATADALAVRPGERVLDVAAGTGTSARPLVGAGAEVWAVDRSEGMVQIGCRNAPSAGFVVADAARLPFADETFDVVTVSFGLRNMASPQVALREFARVTRPGGRIVVCEFSTPRHPWLRAAHGMYLNRVMPLVARLSTHPLSYGYLAATIADWPRPGVIAQMMRTAGWRDVSFKRLTGGIVALHRGRRPLEIN